MNPERRGLILVVVVLLISALLGGIYGPSVRATTAATDDYQTAVRDFTNVLSVVQAFFKLRTNPRILALLAKIVSSQNRWAR